MINLGECPKCAKRVLHVNIDNVIGLIGGESKARCLSYSCIHCNAVLGVQIDPRAQRRVRRKSQPAEQTPRTGTA